MYKIADAIGSVQRIGDGAFIPSDRQNRHWIDYEKWLENGNIPEPFVIPLHSPRKFSAKNVIGCLSAPALLKMRNYAEARLAAGKTGEWAYLYQEPQWFENNPKLIRLINSSELDVTSLFDLVEAL